MTVARSPAKEPCGPRGGEPNQEERGADDSGFPFALLEVVSDLLVSRLAQADFIAPTEAAAFLKIDGALAEVNAVNEYRGAGRGGVDPHGVGAPDPKQEDADRPGGRVQGWEVSRQAARIAKSPGVGQSAKRLTMSWES